VRRLRQFLAVDAGERESAWHATDISRQHTEQDVRITDLPVRPRLRGTTGPLQGQPRGHAERRVVRTRSL